MKAKYGGPMKVEEFFQALFQDREFFARHGITHVRGTYLYFTPCDAYGQPVIITDQGGNPIDGYASAGGYRPAADQYDYAYDPGNLEPRPLCRSPARPPRGAA